MAPKSRLLKWWTTIQINWGRHTVYRADFLLRIIGPSLVFFFVKYNLWSSIYQGDEAKIIQGYTFHEMIGYHAWAMIVALLAQSHNALDLAEDIRFGRISAYMIYPFNFWEFHTASFLAFQGMQFLVGVVSFAVFVLTGLLQVPSVGVLALAGLYSFTAGLLWFSIQFLTGLLAFWLEETWILRVIVSTLTTFLSGAIIPLELFPEWLRGLLNFTPFPYLTFYAVKLFQGDLANVGLAFSVLVVWTGLMAAICSFVWKKGVRLYTAAGM